MIEEKAARNLHRGEAEEERARQRADASGPIDRSRIRSSPIVTLEARKKWLAIYAVANVRTMTRPPTGGRWAPFRGLHRWGFVPLVCCYCLVAPHTVCGPEAQFKVRRSGRETAHAAPPGRVAARNSPATSPA